MSYSRSKHHRLSVRSVSNPVVNNIPDQNGGVHHGLELSLVVITRSQFHATHVWNDAHAIIDGYQIAVLDQPRHVGSSHHAVEDVSQTEPVIPHRSRRQAKNLRSLLFVVVNDFQVPFRSRPVNLVDDEQLSFRKRLIFPARPESVD